MKPGRNDPCPCGSGKKYKHCCLASAAAAEESPAELAWRRIRRAVDDYGIAQRMVRFLNDTYGPAALAEAWDEFMCWPGDAEDEGEEVDRQVEFDPESPFVPVFMSWFFHCWTPDVPGTAIEDTSLHDRVPTALFLERQRGIEPVVRRYLEACVEVPFGFHEITRCDPGHGFASREIFSGEEFEVIERSASRTLQAHDIVYAQLVRVDGLTLMECCSPVSFPPSRKIEMLDFRDEIGKAGHTPRSEILRDYDIELREMYLAIAEEILEPAIPELRNTDGEPLVPHRLVFEIDSPQTAFDALKHLACGEGERELLESAGRDSKGNLVSVELAWKKAGNAMHRHWDNTVLGHLRIKGDRLTCEVNSAERATLLRKLIEQALGSRARHRSTTVQSLERELATRMAAGEGSAKVRDEEQARLAQSPEIRAKLSEMLAAHYEDWPTEKLPALGGETPLEAVKTPAGRERVEALVNDIERDSAHLPAPPDPAIFRRLRGRLGLTPGG